MCCVLHHVFAPGGPPRALARIGSAAARPSPRRASREHARPPTLAPFDTLQVPRSQIKTTHAANASCMQKDSLRGFCHLISYHLPPRCLLACLLALSVRLSFECSRSPGLSLGRRHDASPTVIVERARLSLHSFRAVFFLSPPRSRWFPFVCCSAGSCTRAAHEIQHPVPADLFLCCYCTKSYETHEPFTRLPPREYLIHSLCKLLLRRMPSMTLHGTLFGSSSFHYGRPARASMDFA